MTKLLHLAAMILFVAAPAWGVHWTLGVAAIWACIVAWEWVYFDMQLLLRGYYVDLWRAMYR